MLFTELPFLQRFEAAREAGFAAVELLFPYEYDATEIKRALIDSGMPLVLFNTPLGAHLGSGAVAEADFAADFSLALDYANILQPQHIHIMSGNAVGEEAKKLFIANLKHACHLAPRQNLLIEPINPIDRPQYFLQDFATARQIIETVDADNLGLQFDAYHAQMMGRDPLFLWAGYKDIARHIQIAGTPGRHEPLPSDIDYSAFFQAVDQSDYSGFVSAEYQPTGTTLNGLGWMD